MKKTLFTICIALLFLPEAFAQTKTFTNDLSGYTIEYPETWTQGDIGTIIFFRSPLEGAGDIVAENVTVAVEDMSEGPGTLDQYTDKFLKEATRIFPGFRPIERGEAEINDRGARYMVYYTTQFGQDLKHKIYYFSAGRRMFSLTYTAHPDMYDKYLPFAEEIMRSIRAE